MSYRVHSKRAQLSLFKDDDLPKEIIKPEPMSKNPDYIRFRKMVRKVWNTKNKPKI